MSASTAQAAPPSKTTTTPQWLHNCAIAVSILGPVALFLPPRRLELRTLGLMGVTLWGTNQLAYDYTGRSAGARFQDRLVFLTTQDLPDKAKETQARLREERARRLAALPDHERRALQEADQRRRDGLLKRIWRGGEPDDWYEKRLREEQEALASGKSYWSLITDQISDVWSQGGKKKGDAPSSPSSSPPRDRDGRKSDQSDPPQ